MHGRLGRNLGWIFLDLNLKVLSGIDETEDSEANGFFPTGQISKGEY